MRRNANHMIVSTFTLLFCDPVKVACRTADLAMNSSWRRLGTTQSAEATIVFAVRLRSPSDRLDITFVSELADLMSRKRGRRRAGGAAGIKADPHGGRKLLQRRGCGNDHKIAARDKRAKPIYARVRAGSSERASSILATNATQHAKTPPGRPLAVSVFED
jgi:hypothetical protein